MASSVEAMATPPQGGDVAQPDLASLAAKYEQEKQKRTRADGADQYIDLEEADETRHSSRHLAHLIDDPWVDHAALNAATPPIKHGDDVKFLILGSGFCGLVHAVRLIEAGFSADNIRLVDTAGDVGGTWYWNRYPGLRCDSEASIYLPLLEETGYMPKQRYSSGEEIRLHAVRIADKWRLRDKALFRTAIKNFVWDDQRRRWVVSMRTERGPTEKAVDLIATAQFIVLANGILAYPKVPKIEGLDEFQGQTVHTSRWKYDVTGGEPGQRLCDKLQGKRVGFIGTGATGVQCATALAKSAGELLVFQRTPSAVYERGQRENNAKDWAEKVATGPGWWTARNANFAATVSGEPGVTEDLVDDCWSKLPTYRFLVGGPHAKYPMPIEKIPQYIQHVMELDGPSTEKARRRVDQLVTKNKETADALKAWYPTWCKRPTFHDEYLDIFNQDNVSLVQTDGHGVQKATSKGLVVNGKEYELDLIVFGTGYRSPAKDFGEPSRMSNATITGKSGVTLRHKWLESETGARSLHGVLTNDFPNMIMTGPAMTGASASVTYLVDILARHMAHIVAEATRKAGEGASNRLTIEATSEAEAGWSAEIASRAAYASTMSICTPSYLTDDGSLKFSPKFAGASYYSAGVNAYAAVLKEWREKGGLEGLEVSF